MKRMLSHLVVLAIATATHALAAETTHSYALVSDGSDRMTAFFDTRTVEKSGGTIDAWLLMVYHPALHNSEGSVQYTMERARFACSLRTIQREFIAYYASDDTLLGTEPMGTMDPIIPDSAGEEIYARLCKGEGPANMPTAPTVQEAVRAALSAFKNSQSQGSADRPDGQ